jgi:D-beta-D-heptose 7-phosphate kinase/D-beta-D-heptose 1-phosphate adenosyltransferase
MNLARVEELVCKFSSKRVLVIGDLMLDEFVWGRVSRISPEAPVPVVEVVRESYYPGGAANVARNVREFTPSVSVTGLVGADTHATKLSKLLAENGIGLDGLQSDPTFQTIVKTRIIARHQQVVRVDRERPQPLSEQGRGETVRKIRESLPDIDAIIFEDYGKGLLQQEFVDEVTALARAGGKLVTADPNPHNRIIWRGMTAVKPNRSEAFAAASQTWREPGPDPLRDAPLLLVGAELLRLWSPELLLVTLGEQGMILFSQHQPPYHVPSHAREVYDLSGAGDTAIALFTLALASGASPIEAAEISNHASSVVVGKLGTATLSPQELVESFRNSSK